MKAALRVYTIYERPDDYPEWPYVIRLFYVVAGGVLRTHVCFGAQTLEDARGRLEDFGFTRFPRQEEDDPKIVETWM